jgi:hypothetical protein
MKNRTSLKGIFGLVLIIILIGFSCAFIFQQVSVKYAYFDNFGNWTETETAIENFSIFGIPCNDYTCSSNVFGWLINQTIISDKVNVSYPNQVPAGTYGYGIYFVKEGYIPYEVRVYN